MTTLAKAGHGTLVPWPQPSDARLLELGWERWRQIDPAPAWQDDRLLSALFGNSPFLTDCAVREPDLLQTIAADGPTSVFDGLIGALWRDQAEAEQEEPFMAALRRAKRQAALLIALADIGGSWSLDQITGALSRFAETSLRLTTRLCLRIAANRGGLRLSDPAEPEHRSGLIVLGMGKLGAAELNYSSDIDLIIFYDPERIQTGDLDRLPRTMIRLVRSIVRIMEEHTADGYVFRTDLRLRPDPGATPLAVSLGAAENYYASLAQNWERAAMIKARPIAGDLEAGEAFLTFLQPFIWRRNLDFASLQDIHGIKRQLDRKAGTNGMAIEGHDLKIGRGGIREIEFFAQTQQMIYGGRDPRLRSRRTVDTLQTLAKVGRIGTDVAEELSTAYARLRRIEHRLQMTDDQQTQRLPETPDGVARLACFLGEPDADFRDALQATLATVERQFGQLFSETTGDNSGLIFTGPDALPDTERVLAELGFSEPAKIVDTVRGWLHGRYRAVRSDRSRGLLTQMLPQLLAAIGRSPHPDTAFNRFDKFLAGLPAGIQLFSMFRAQPSLLNFVVELLGISDRMADHLAQNPEELDAVLTPGFFDTLPNRAELTDEIERLLAPAQYHEDELDILRQWTRDHRFRAGAQLLRGTTTGDRLGPYLTAIADAGLAALQERVAAEFARRHGRFSAPGLAIVAMGKLGSGQMSIRSDLDLIMVFDAGDQAESDGDKPLGATVYFTRLIQRIVSAITAQTAEGALYEVDMRLRPSGNAGPLATSFEAFAKYHDESAWTWEHMALTRARCITGDPEMRARLGDMLQRILTRRRDPASLYRDVADMRQRIEKEHRQTSPWAVKHVRGGLVDIEFIAQCLQLHHAAEQPSVLHADTKEALVALGKAGILAETTVDDLAAALALGQRIQAYERLVQVRIPDLETAPPSILDGLKRAAFPADAPASLQETESRVHAVQETAHRHYVELVETPARQAGWEQ
ncbi:MAG: bifunctional [glutamine synthetase] adenylyltransferase/[glutamine synthetase]-adenylyl-L-tyrosine phosphorylase [Pseudomonadota bacterium]